MLKFCPAACQQCTLPSQEVPASGAAQTPTATAGAGSVAAGSTASAATTGADAAGAAQHGHEGQGAHHEHEDAGAQQEQVKREQAEEHEAGPLDEDPCMADPHSWGPCERVPLTHGMALYDCPAQLGSMQACALDSWTCILTRLAGADASVCPWREVIAGGGGGGGGSHPMAAAQSDFCGQPHCPRWWELNACAAQKSLPASSRVCLTCKHRPAILVDPPNTCVPYLHDVLLCVFQASRICRCMYPLPTQCRNQKSLSVSSRVCLTCKHRPAILADPPDACVPFLHNAHHLGRAVVVVIRRGCAFAAKAQVSPQPQLSSGGHTAWLGLKAAQELPLEEWREKEETSFTLLIACSIDGPRG
eukprot:1160513-Pelagomonas_calceolata.AAC.18